MLGKPTFKMKSDIMQLMMLSQLADIITLSEKYCTFVTIDLAILTAIHSLTHSLACLEREREHFPVK